MSLLVTVVVCYLFTERSMQLVGQPSQCVMQQSNLSPGLSQFLSKLQLSSFGTGPCCFQLLLKTPVLLPTSHKIQNIM